MTTGSTVKLGDERFKNTQFTVVARGGTSTVPSGKAVLFPFNPIDGPSQDATLELSDTTTINVSYDDSTNEIDVGGTVYSVGDNFVLDGQRVTVYDI